MILLALIAALTGAPASAQASASPAPDLSGQVMVKPDPVTEPEWLSVPSSSLMHNCTVGYLTDPNFAGESIIMGCAVLADGTLGQCRVKESKAAQSAGVQDVAVCASAGFRIGPLDKAKKPTVGRPMIIPMAIMTPDPNAQAAAPASSQAPSTTTPPPPPPPPPPK